LIFKKFSDTLKNLEVKGVLKIKRYIISITKMAVTVEAVVFHHLQANCSAKTVEKFCKELNFNPPEKKVGENDNIITIDEIVKCLKNSSPKQEPEVANKKKRKISESDSSSSDSDEETFTPKKAKIDLSTTECYKCHKTGHMSRECPLNNPQKETDYVPDESDIECYSCKRLDIIPKIVQKSLLECPVTTVEKVDIRQENVLTRQLV